MISFIRYHEWPSINHGERRNLRDGTLYASGPNGKRDITPAFATNRALALWEKMG